MQTYRYTLQPYKGLYTRHTCPACNKPKTFTLYIDTQTNQPLHPTVGRCNREVNCGYHYKPKQYFEANPGINNSAAYFIPLPKAAPMPVSYIPSKVFDASMQAYDQNNFVRFLFNRFGPDITTKLIERYYIGTSNHWPGATVFWQLDRSAGIRTGKIMLYNALTGRRIKKPFNHITWAHSNLHQPAYYLQQCLFGEHLLHYTTKPVAIVESEKTAIIASVYYPHQVWLATGSLNMLNPKQCAVLKGRYVTLYPDLNCFNTWLEKAQQLKHIAAFNVNDKLEYTAPETDIKQGFDLADYLLQFNHLNFIKHYAQHRA